MMLWQIAFRFLHSWSPFLFSNVSSKSFPWCTSSPVSELVYGNRQWKGLSCKKNYLRNIWRESVMRQVSLKLSSLSFGISRCCCRRDDCLSLLRMPVPFVCCLSASDVVLVGFAFTWTRPMFQLAHKCANTSAGRRRWWEQAGWCGKKGGTGCLAWRQQGVTPGRAIAKPSPLQGQWESWRLGPRGLVKSKNEQ